MKIYLSVLIVVLWMGYVIHDWLQSVPDNTPDLIEGSPEAMRQFNKECLGHVRSRKVDDKYHLWCIQRKEKDDG